MTLHPVPTVPIITGVILAGGLGTRMGGVDKGLQLFAGQPLVSQITKRFAPQVDQLLINANRNGAEYARLGYPLISDRISDFAGPLAGLQAALSTTENEWVATVPCDSPRLPLDLVSRLYSALIVGNAKLAFATAGGRLHPVFCLCHISLLPELTAYLNGGGRKVTQWCNAMKAIEVDFSDQTDAFSNLNTIEELLKTNAFQIT